MDGSQMIRELEPTVEQLMDRHLATTKEWFPHELIPYGRGKDFDAETPWSANDSDLAGSTIDDAVRSSLMVNLLTEDNLPYYFRDIQRVFGDDGPWGAWSRRWTAEEGRHSMVIYGYLMVTRARGSRAARALLGCTRSRRARCPTPAATFDAHRLRRAAGAGHAHRPPQHGAAARRLRRIRRHDARRRRREPAPPLLPRPVPARRSSSTRPRWSRRSSVRSAASRCPAPGSPTSRRTPAAIAHAGIYDLTIHHDQILVPVVLRHWAVESLTGLTPEAEAAREQLMSRLAKSERVARRMAARRAEAEAAVPV